MVAIIVTTPEEVTTFNNSITPLMLSAGQIMERWVDEAQCPHKGKCVSFDSKRQHI